MNDLRYPNGASAAICGFRRTDFGKMAIGNDSISGLAFEGFFEDPDPPYTPYVPPALVPGVIGKHGDWAFPNPDGNVVMGFRRTVDRMDGLLGISNDALFGTWPGAYRAYMKGILVKVWR